MDCPDKLAWLGHRRATAHVCEPESLGPEACIALLDVDGDRSNRMSTSRRSVDVTPGRATIKGSSPITSTGRGTVDQEFPSCPFELMLAWSRA